MDLALLAWRYPGHVARIGWRSAPNDPALPWQLEKTTARRAIIPVTTPNLPRPVDTILPPAVPPPAPFVVGSPALPVPAPLLGAVSVS
jgi:hypothetical protein